MATLSSNLLYIAFVMYLIGTFVFTGTIKGKNDKRKYDNWAKAGITITIIGFISPEREISFLEKIVAEIIMLL